MSQISHIKLKDITEARRYDAECFSLLDIIKKRFDFKNNFVFLNDSNFFKIIDGDRGKNYPNGDDFSNNNNDYCLFLNTSNVLKAGFDFSNNQYISKDKDVKLGNGKLIRGDIVFTTRGTIGNMGIFNDFVTENNIRINSGMVIFRSQNINKNYLFVCLLTDYVTFQIKAYSSGSVQSQIPINTLKNIKIPLLKNDFQIEISDIFLLSQQKQGEAKKLYKEAEKLLLSELGLLDFKPKNALTFSATKKEVEEAQRFDSEYFEPKYYDIIDKIEKYSSGWDFVKNIVSWKKGYEVGTGAYTETGKDFVRVSDFSVYGISEVNRKISEQVFEELKKIYQPKEGEILFTKDGTIGISYVLKEKVDGILSGAFLRLNLKEEYKDFEKECLSLIFSSIVCRMQVDRLSGGALIAHLKPSDFESFKIPLLKESIQKQIAEKITESYKLRKESKELLEKAKRMVEEEIEK